MQLPNVEQSNIGRRKVSHNLLSHDYPVGRFKAVFFESLGYSNDDPDQSSKDLLNLARNSAATMDERNAYGQKYAVRGMLNGPNGGKAYVVTVWIIIDGESVPRFVTAVPG